jgi:ketosteroid isomerase-like protein
MIFRTSVLVAAALILSAACAHRPAQRAGGEYPRLDARQNSFLEALSARDLERTTGYFAADASVHVANMPTLRGRDAIGGFYGNVFRFLRESSSVPEMIEMSASEDLAYSTGAVANAFDSPDGRVEFTGKYILVWKRVAGEWLIAHYGISNDQPASDR